MLGDVKVRIKSMCDMIMHHDDGNRKKIKDPESPENKRLEFENAQYRNSSDELCLPAEMIEACMEKAAGSFILKGKKTYRDIVSGGVLISPREPAFVKGTIAIPYSKMVRIPPKTGARILKTRAMVESWELEFTISILNDSINFETLKDILVYAGAYVGVGAWRPKHGRFEVVKFEKA